MLVCIFYVLVFVSLGLVVVQTIFGNIPMHVDSLNFAHPGSLLLNFAGSLIVYILVLVRTIINFTKIKR